MTDSIFPAAPVPGDHSRFHIYVQIAMTLSVLTGIEIVIIFLPWEKWFVVACLVVLSVVKFMFVIFFFMHLRWDKVFCTILFMIGLVLAGGTMWALLALFGTEESTRVEAATAAAPANAWVAAAPEQMCWKMFCATPAPTTTLHCAPRAAFA